MKIKFEKFTEEELDFYKKSLKVKILEKDFTIFSEGDRYWKEISTNQLIFDKKEIKAELVEAITLEDFKFFFNEIFFNCEKRLEIHTISKKHGEDNEKFKLKRNIKKIDNLYQFKKESNLYPDFY